MRYLFILSLWAVSAHSSPLLDQWADEFSFDHKSFSGDWSEHAQWEGTFCNGRSSYLVRIGGEIVEVKFKLMDDYIHATAALKDVWGYLEGSYRSSYSACTTLSGWIGLSSDWAHLKINVYLNASEAATHVNRIEIVETNLGRLRFGLWLPDYLEEYATYLSDRALANIWASRLGEWINHKISEELRKRRDKKGISLAE